MNDGVGGSNESVRRSGTRLDLQISQNYRSGLYRKNVEYFSLEVCIEKDQAARSVTTCRKSHNANPHAVLEFRIQNQIPFPWSPARNRLSLGHSPSVLRLGPSLGPSRTGPGLCLFENAASAPPLCRLRTTFFMVAHSPNLS